MKLSYLLAVVAGARTDLLDKLPGQIARQSAMGAVLLTTAFFAAISASYALIISRVASNPAVAIAFGLLWGLAILNLDRMLVMGLGKERDWRRLLVLAAPRVVLAVVIGVVISTPLMLKVFEPEVNAKMQENILHEQEALRQTVDNSTTAVDLKIARQELAVLQSTINTGPTADPDRNPDVAAIQREIDALSDKAATEEKVYDERQSEATAEEDGTGGTGRAGCAATCVRKRQLADEAKQRWNDTKDQIHAKQLEKQQRITELEPSLQAGSENAIAQAKKDLPLVQQRVDFLQNTIDESHGTNRDVAVNDTGLIARLKALHDASNGDATTALARWAVAALFMCMELLPVIFKVLTNLGAPTAYDETVDSIEQMEGASAQEDWLKRQREAENQVAAERAADDHERAKLDIRRKTELAAEEDQARQREETLGMVNAEVAEHQREVISEALQSWRVAARRVTTERLHDMSQRSNGAGDPSGPPSYSMNGAGDPSGPPSYSMNGAGDPSGPPSYSMNGAGDPSGPPSYSMNGAGDPSGPPSYSMNGHRPTND